jgi:cytochrome c biogenesis factor
MAELGRFALLIGLFLSGYAILADLLGSWREDNGLLESGRNATIACFACLTVATVALLVLLVQSDFSVNYVAEHTSKALPLAYKFSALWAGCGCGCRLDLYRLLFADQSPPKESSLLTGGLLRIWLASSF